MRAGAHDISTEEHTYSCYTGEQHIHNENCGAEQSDCLVCNGSGQINDHVATWKFVGSYLNSCTWCGVNATLYEYECKACGQNGYVLEGISCGHRDDMRDTFCRITCPSCNGSGKISGTPISCSSNCILHQHTNSCSGYGRFVDIRFSFNRFGYDSSSLNDGSLDGPRRDIIGVFPEAKTAIYSGGRCIYCNWELAPGTTYYDGSYNATWRIYCTGCDEYINGGASTFGTWVYLCSHCNKYTFDAEDIYDAKTEDGESYYSSHNDCSRTYFSCGKVEGTSYIGNSLCTTCFGKGYSIVPPCLLTAGLYYDTNGNLCSPVCNKTITNIVFSQ